MQINENYLTKLLSSILLFVCSYTLANQRDLHSVDGTYSSLFTSPRLTGVNITNLIKVDLNKPLNCITTLDLESSWILIDLGFVVSGIAKLILYGDDQNQDIHNYLSNIEIKMAQIVTLKEISDSFPHENMYFKTCGTTGTVSQHTHNVVVECIKGFDTRWILLKKKNILSLCLINIFQNTVKPQCFRQIIPDNELFSKVSLNFNDFKSMNYKTPLECFQSCSTENSCQATAFTPYKTNLGVCKLLKSKTIKHRSSCDDACILSVNLCQLGKQIKIGSTNKDIILKLPLFEKSIFVSSVEIDGYISCNEENCGETKIFIIDSNGEKNLCSIINPLKYKFLVKEVFICKNLVKNPIELILKTQTKHQLYKYSFNSITLRILEENSFLLDLFSYFDNEKTSTETIKTTLLTTETSKIGTKESINLQTRSSFLSTSEMKTNFLKFISSNIPNIINLPSNITLLETTKEKVLKNSYVKSTISVSNKKITSKPISTNKNATNSNKTVTLLIKKKLSTNSPKLSTTFIKTILETISTEINLQLNVIDSKNSSNQNIKLRNNKELIISRVFTKSPINLKDNQILSTKFLDNRSESLHLPNQSTSLPYNWIILVIFIGILILVTLIVLLITFLESRWKKKEWDIPPNGLFPMDQISEQITLQSSLHESTIRKVS